MAFYLRAHTPSGPPVGAAAAGSAPATRASEQPADHSPAELPEKIALDEVREMMATGEPMVVVDVRTDKSYRADPRRAAFAVRVPPDDPVRSATEQRLSQRSTLVVYCA